MNHVAASGRALVRRPRATSAHRRLICFPHAGAGAAAYAAWAELVPSDVEVVPVRLPGRESRYGEQPPTDIDTLVEAVLPEVRALLDRPLYFFGYSMGALLAHRVAIDLQRRTGTTPAGVVVGGHESPTRAPRPPALHDLPDEQFRRAIAALGGTPNEVFDHPGLFELISPALRADLRLVETRRPAAADHALRAPLAVYRGADDDTLLASGVQAWRDVAAHQPVFRTFPGGHFDLLADPAALVSAVCHDLGLIG